MHRIGLCCVSCVLIVITPTGTAGAPMRGESAVADTIFVGQFLTLDQSHPTAEAIAVFRGRIVAVGRHSDVEAHASKDTRRIRFSGVALPGFEDAHIHVAAVGSQLERLNLRGLSKEQILRKVAEAVRFSTPEARVLGEGWDQGFWSPAVFPSSKELDRVSRNHPVFLNRIDGHSTWVNSKVLALAKISRATPDPEGGHIVRNALGKPTGILVDNAQNLIRPVIPKPTHADVEQ